MPGPQGAPTDASAAEGHGTGAARSGLIERADAVAALDRAAEKQVTVISAPAGSGKTCLLRAWADQPGQVCRIAFVSVGPAHQDAQMFWLDVLRAVRAAITATDPPIASPGSSGEAMAERVRSELAASNVPVILIIDDLHELGSVEVTEQLRALLTKLPPGVHAIVSTRGGPPLGLHRLRLAGELAEIRATQLRFTQGETRALLTAAGITLPDPVIATLHERTEGWAAGLRLAVLSLVGHPDPEQFVAEFTGSDRMVAEYLLAEMLDRQPPPVQRLLLRTSLLDRVNGELADLLTGAAGSERILLDLEDASAFVVSLDPDRTWFRYHHMFAGLLRLELRHTQPRDIPDLHRLAARWFADHSQTADAIRHLQEASEWTEAARILSDHALSLTLDGQAETVAALLRGFPEQTDESLPSLALVHAVADLEHLRLEQADAHLRIARGYAATTARDRQYRLRMAIASLDLLSARLRGHLDAVVEQVGELPSAQGSRSHADVALVGDLRALALLNLGVTEAWSLRLQDSRRHLEEGAALAREIGRPYLEVACLAHLGFAATGQSFALARQQCERAIAQAAQHGWDAEAVIAPAQATLAGILIWTGEFDHGEQWLKRARRATQAGSEPGVQLLIHLISAILAAARGQLSAALAEFLSAGQVQERMIGEHALTPRVTGWTIATQARLGLVEQARAALNSVSARLSDTDELRNAAAAVCLAEHDPAQARRVLRAVLLGNDATKPPLSRIEAHLLDAFASRDLGDQGQARKAVEQALNLAEPDRLVLPFVMTGAWQLLSAVPPRTSHRALVADMLDAVDGGRPASATAHRPAEELSPSELRVLRYLPTNLTRPEIAEQLSLSPNTVNTHVRRIYLKLGATDRSSAVRRGRELRLLSSGRA